MISIGKNHSGYRRGVSSSKGSINGNEREGGNGEGTFSSEELVGHDKFINLLSSCIFDETDSRLNTFSQRESFILLSPCVLFREC